MKPLSSDSYIVRPFPTYKRHTYTLTYLSTTSDEISVYEATQPPENWLWQGGDEALNYSSSLYKNSLYASINHMFYRSSINGRIPEPISLVELVGSGSNKTSGTTLSVTPTINVPIGSVLVVEVATDNSVTGSIESTDHTISSSPANTWTKIREVNRGTAVGSGITTSLWASLITTEITTSDSITLTLATAVTAKIFTARSFTLATGWTVNLGAIESGILQTVDVSPAVNSPSLTSRDWLLLGLVGRERLLTGITQPAGWTERPSEGTSDGSAESNVSVTRADKVLTPGSGVQTYNPTFGSATDMAAIIAAIPLSYSVDTTTTTSSYNRGPADFDKRYHPSGSGEAYVITVNQAVYGEKIKERTFSLDVSTIGDTIIDDGQGRLVYSSDTGSVVGNIFYGMGIAVVSSSLALTTGSTVDVSFNSVFTIYEHMVMCTLNRGEFNFSTNATLQLNQSSSIDGDGLLFDALASGSLTPYMTTVGLYDSDNELVAIAKFPRPLRREPDLEQTIIVRLDI